MGFDIRVMLGGLSVSRAIPRALPVGLGLAVAVVVSACGSDPPGGDSAGVDAGTLADGSITTDLHDAATPQFPDTGSAVPTACTPQSLDQQGCECTPGQTRACYTGPAKTRNVGTCRDGTQTCRSSGELSNHFGPCSGDVLPTSASDCTPVVDAGAPKDAGDVKDSGPIIVLDAGLGGDADAAPPIAVAGAPCTPGEVKDVPSGTSGCADYGASLPKTSLYCDASSVWHCFPAGNCSAAACAACLTAHHCDATISTTTVPACKDGLEKAFTWLSGCGPDRSAYFQSFGAACTGGELSTMNGCKFSNCIGSNSSPCSLY